MRLPLSYDADKRQLRVAQVIHQLGLTQCSQTRVGDELLKGML